MTHRRTIVEGDIKKFIEKEIVPIKVFSLPVYSSIINPITEIIIDNRDLIQRQVEEQLEEDDY